MEKTWKEVPMLTSCPKEIGEALKNVFGDDRKNAYQMLYLIGEHESENDYDKDMILINKYLRDSGFNGDEILIDNTWQEIMENLFIMVEKTTYFVVFGILIVLSIVALYGHFLKMYNDIESNKVEKMYKNGDITEDVYKKYKQK